MRDKTGSHFAYNTEDILSVPICSSTQTIQFFDVSSRKAIQRDLPEGAFPLGWLD